MSVRSLFGSYSAGTRYWNRKCISERAIICGNRFGKDKRLKSSETTNKRQSFSFIHLFHPFLSRFRKCMRFVANCALAWANMYNNNESRRRIASWKTMEATRERERKPLLVICWQSILRYSRTTREMARETKCVRKWRKKTYKTEKLIVGERITQKAAKTLQLREMHKTLFSVPSNPYGKTFFFSFLVLHIWGAVSVCAPKNNSTSPNRSFGLLLFCRCFHASAYISSYSFSVFIVAYHIRLLISARLLFIKIGWEDGKNELWITCISSRIFSIPIAFCCCCCYSDSAPGLMEIFINFSSICQSRLDANGIERDFRRRSWRYATRIDSKKK